MYGTFNAVTRTSYNVTDPFGSCSICRNHRFILVSSWKTVLQSLASFHETLGYPAAIRVDCFKFKQAKAAVTSPC